MKEFYGNYLGVVITGGEKDPEGRGRTQIFIPHIMPALYEQWNKEGKDISFEVIGQGLEGQLDPQILFRLQQILPWAECAAPIIGASPSYKPNILGQASETLRNVGSAIVETAKSAANTLGNFAFGEDKAASSALSDFLTGKDRNEKGYCGRGVKNLLVNAYGYKDNEVPGANGQDWGKNLENLGWTKVPVNNPKDAPDGAVLVYDSDVRRGQPLTRSKRTGAVTGGATSGHVEIKAGGKYFFGMGGGQNSPGGSVPQNFNGYAYLPPPDVEARLMRNMGLPSETPSADPHPQPATGMTPDPGTAGKNEEELAAGLNQEIGSAQQLTLQNAEAAASQSFGSIDGVSGTARSSFSGGSVIADSIFESEARLSKNGDLKVYNLPGNDGGGRYEVAGINERYHPQAASQLKNMIQAGQQTEAKQYAKDYIMGYTNTATSMSSNAGAEYALRDATFNRGPGGANWMAKRAAGLDPSKSRSTSDTEAILAAQKADPQGYLKRLYDASVEYERDVVGLRSNLNEGLQKRFRDRLNNSVTLLNGGIPMSNPSDYGKLALDQPTVKNPTQFAGVAGPNTNNQALGMFGYASEGQAVWVFFREGNPLFPVYFAASYGQKEWQNMYGHASPGIGAGVSNTAVDGKFPSTPQATQTGALPGTEAMYMNTYGGGLRSANTTEDSSYGPGFMFQLYDKNGSHLTFLKDHTEFYSCYDHVSRVMADQQDITEANREIRVRGDFNTYAEQDLIVSVGNWSQEAIDASDEIQGYINEAMKIKTQAAQS